MLMRTLMNFAAPFILLAFTACSPNLQDVPVLILGTDRNFGTYTAEILKAEGFNVFHLDSISGNKISASYLHEFNMVILAEPDPDPGTIQLLYNYVEKGGNLIAFRPNPAFSELFGIVSDKENLTGGYLHIDTTTEQGNGLSGKTLQLHVPGDSYALAGGTPVAFFAAADGGRERNPAVVYHGYRKGHAIAFLYNLPQNIVYTRQGNPAFAGIEKDGIHGIRGMDLFAEGWVDTSNNTINQADEQMALLSHCIETMDKDNLTLPRFWYFPDTLKCLITLTNDGEYKTEADFEPQFRDVDSMGATMSIYLLGVDKVSREWVEKWTAREFEISGHPDDTKEAGNPDWHSMDSALGVRKNEILAAYRLPMRTSVNHWFVWCGREADGTQNFAAQAKLEENNGIALDANYAHYDMNSNQGENYLGTPGTRQGNFTGSGLVMKYADAHGNIIDVYQHLNAVYDQQYNERHDPEGFYNCMKGLVDRSIYNGVYSIIGIKSHNDEYYFSKLPLMQMLDYARLNGIPVWTESRLLDFLTMKDQAAFTGIAGLRNQLKFLVNVPIVQEQSLTLMLPYHRSGCSITGITGNNKPLDYADRIIKGTRYALVPVAAGLTHAITVSYGN
jgi:hypothetical protein